jgi:hypothetical protein
LWEINACGISHLVNGIPLWQSKLMKSLVY